MQIPVEVPGPGSFTIVQVTIACLYLYDCIQNRHFQSVGDSI